MGKKIIIIFVVLVVLSITVFGYLKYSSFIFLKNVVTPVYRETRVQVEDVFKDFNNQNLRSMFALTDPDNYDLVPFPGIFGKYKNVNFFDYAISESPFLKKHVIAMGSAQFEKGSLYFIMYFEMNSNGNLKIDSLELIPCDKTKFPFPVKSRKETKDKECKNITALFYNKDSTYNSFHSDATFYLVGENFDVIEHIEMADMYDEYSTKGMPYKGR